MADEQREPGCCKDCKRKFRSPDGPTDKEIELEQELRGLETMHADMADKLYNIRKEIAELRDARYVGTGWHKCSECRVWTGNEAHLSKFNSKPFYYCDRHGPSDD